MQGDRGAQGPGSARRRLRHGPRRRRPFLGPVPERQQLGAPPTDEFMRAALDGETGSSPRTTGEVVETVLARRLLRDRRGVLGVRRSRRAVRHDDQPLEHDAARQSDRRESRTGPAPGQQHCNLAASTCCRTCPKTPTPGATPSAMVVTAQTPGQGDPVPDQTKIATAGPAACDIGIGYTNPGARWRWACPTTRGRTRRAATITGIMADRRRRCARLRAFRPARPGSAVRGDADAWSGVYRMHLDAAPSTRSRGQPDLNQHLVRLGPKPLDRIAVVGARNAELSVAAPTGTISFMMGADTTGIEPDLGLVKHRSSSAADRRRSSTRPCPGPCADSATTTPPSSDRGRLDRREPQRRRLPDLTPHTCRSSPAPWARQPDLLRRAPADDVGHPAVLPRHVQDGQRPRGHLGRRRRAAPDRRAAQWVSMCVALYRDNCRSASPSPPARRKPLPSAPEQVAIQVVEQVARPVRNGCPVPAGPAPSRVPAADCKGLRDRRRVRGRLSR